MLTRGVWWLIVFALAIGCVGAYVAGPKFYVYVENRSFDQVRIYGVRPAGGSEVPIVTVMPNSTQRVRAHCSDFLSRRMDYRFHTLAGRRDHRTIGEWLATCSDSLVIKIPGGGPRYATVEVW